MYDCCCPCHPLLPQLPSHPTFATHCYGWWFLPSLLLSHSPSPSAFLIICLYVMASHLESDADDRQIGPQDPCRRILAYRPSAARTQRMHRKARAERLASLPRCCPSAHLLRTAKYFSHPHDSLQLQCFLLFFIFPYLAGSHRPPDALHHVPLDTGPLSASAQLAGLPVLSCWST